MKSFLILIITASAINFAQGSIAVASTSVNDDQHDGICMALNDNDPSSTFCRTLSTRHDCLMFSNKCIWSASHPYSVANRVMSSCRVISQDGTQDSWTCRNSPGIIRCYADVQFNDGANERIFGGCFESFDDCWWNGPGAVNPCE